MRNITKLSEQELKLGIVDGKASWHSMYKDSAWIFIGGLSFDLSEGDVIAVFSQYGEVVNINLIRDRKTGKSKGFAFLCYQDQRSTILAVDNLNGIKLLNRVIRVDHVEQYKVPKEFDDITTEMKQLYDEGCAPKPIPLEEKSQSEIKSTSSQHRQSSSSSKKKKEKKQSHKRKSDDSDSDSDKRNKKKHKSSSSKKHKHKHHRRDWMFENAHLIYF